MRWQLLGVTEHTLDALAPFTLEQLRDGAVRSSHNELQNAVKPLRDSTTYQIFVHSVLNKHPQRAGAIQGYALGSGPTSTVHIGAWTTKGFPQPTERKAEYVGRTLCHELGHALSLKHTSKRVWSDGCFMAGSHARVFEGKASARPFRNVMAGASDAKGGAGGHLEPWQIIQARRCAIDNPCSAPPNPIREKSAKGPLY